MGGFDINFFRTSFNNVSKTNSVSNQPVENDIKVENKVSNPIDGTPVYTEEDFAEMWIAAGVEPTEAPVAKSTVRSLAAVENAGFDLGELDEIFADEPEVVAQTITSFQNGTATRIGRTGEAYSSIIDNMPEDAPEGFFEAFMYAINDREAA